MCECVSVSVSVCACVCACSCDRHRVADRQTDIEWQTDRHTDRDRGSPPQQYIYATYTENLIV